MRKLEILLKDLRENQYYSGVTLDASEVSEILEYIRKKDEEIMQLKADSCYLENAGMKGRIRDLEAEIAKRQVVIEEKDKKTTELYTILHAYRFREQEDGCAELIQKYENRHTDYATIKGSGK